MRPNKVYDIVEHNMPRYHNSSSENVKLTKGEAEYKKVEAAFLKQQTKQRKRERNKEMKEDTWTIIQVYLKTYLSGVVRGSKTMRNHDTLNQSERTQTHILRQTNQSLTQPD